MEEHNLLRLIVGVGTYMKILKQFRGFVYYIYFHT